MPSIAETHDSRLPHRLAVALVCATFPLVWVGGLVTTYEAGMAVPDWPTTYGYNLFLYPWQTWIAGPWDLFIEHGHRLLAASVGLLVIVEVACLFAAERRRWLRWYGVALLAAVIAQGVLGGMRVRMDERLLAKIHACTGPAFFAMCVALAAFTSRGWLGASPRVYARATRLHVLATFTAAVAFLQIVMGARLRHPDLQLAPNEFADAVVWHLLIAGVLVLHVGLLSARIWREYRDQPRLVRPATALVALVGVQLALGIGTWVANYGWPVWFQGYAWAERHVVVHESLGQALVTTAHVANGSLILAVSVLVALRSLRWVCAAAPVAALTGVSLGVAA
ncbi:MAG TPA: COX15/CtaA family protein [Pirellulales bacterium]|jgi:cytochrome c oxidase assembly protein subunit 15|nr:COX15/CtaA family protein [Pirellulales bacterium]